MPSTAKNAIDELTLGAGARLEELIDRQSIEALAKSFADLFGVGVRLFDQDGKLLADASLPVELTAYLGTLKRARAGLEGVVGAVKSVDPGPKGQTVDCVSGGRYLVHALDHDGRRVGRVVIGPYYPTSVFDLPASLLELEADLDIDRARGLFTLAPRVSDDNVERLGRHIRATFDVVMFSGLKALLTSNMHLASVRESYRELENKNAKLQVAYDRLKELDRLK